MWFLVSLAVIALLLLYSLLITGVAYLWYCRVMSASATFKKINSMLKIAADCQDRQAAYTRGLEQLIDKHGLSDQVEKRSYDA